MRYGGHLALVGVLSGFGRADPMPILARSIRVSGIDARAAYARLISGAHMGKIVVKV